MEHVPARKPATRKPDPRLRIASADHVDVFWVSLAQAASEQDFAILCGSERDFAARLGVGAGPWVAARAALRRVLASYLGIPPRQVAIELGEQGKPKLALGSDADVRFNLSHSGTVALIAVRLGIEVGVDVEHVRPDVDWDSIRRFHDPAGDSPIEASFAGGISLEAGFRGWVRREALAKAAGHGIASLRSTVAATRWTVRDLAGVDGYAAAVASEGQDWVVRSVEAPSAIA